MTAAKRTKRRTRRQGFTLIELLISMVVLLTVLGVVMGALVQLQRRNAGENDKMDLTQSAREFVDQAERDLHQSGFPNPNMFNAPTTPAINNKYIAAGLVSVDANRLQFEGDVDSNGNVQSVTLELVGSDGVTVGGACPCTLKRGRVAKVDGSPFQQPAGAQTVPTYYSELGNVATTNVFSAYDQYGYAVPLPIDLTTAPVATASPASPVTIKSIKAIRFVVNVQSSKPDQESKTLPIVSMTSEARILN